jgi:hypothetical protein
MGGHTTVDCDTVSPQGSKPASSILKNNSEYGRVVREKYSIKKFYKSSGYMGKHQKCNIKKSFTNPKGTCMGKPKLGAKQSISSALCKN